MAADKKRPAYRLSLGGLLVALIVVTTAAGAYAPTAGIAIFSLSSLCVAIAILETGLSSGVIIYITAGLLAIAWPGISLAWPFILFFGPYPLVRNILGVIITNRHWAMILRLLFANLATAVVVLTVMSSHINLLYERLGNWFWILPVFLQIVFILYDMGLSLLIRLYKYRIRLN